MGKQNNGDNRIFMIGTHAYRTECETSRTKRIRDNRRVVWEDQFENLIGHREHNANICGSNGFDPSAKFFPQALVNWPKILFMR